eukprot:871352_1
MSYNQAREGGGIYTTYGTYHLYEVKCQLNRVRLSGGCIFDDNPIYGSLHSTVVNSILSNNTAIISGGAVHFTGGAVRTSSTLNVSNTIFSNNTVYGGIGGGGVYVSDYGNYFGQNNTFSFNYALQ